MAFTKIGKISRVVSGKPSGSGDSGPVTNQPGESGKPIPGTPQPGQPGPTATPKPKKARPSTVTLSPDEKLPGEFIEKIEQQLQREKEWNIGKTNPGGTEPAGGTQGPQIESPLDDGDDTREWDKTPGQMDQEIDRAIKAGLEEQRKAEREAKTDTEKTMGGSGRGGIRDRLEIQMASQTDWAKIFESRLTEYSREASKYLPYHRRFVSNPRMRTRIPSRTQQKDTLPEMNLIIDTSSSLSYRELEVILMEVKKALQSAKIKAINLILWTGTPYFHKSYTDVSGKKFESVIDDIQSNWEGGGNDVNTVYELMKEKGWSKKFTISLTDGYIRDHFSGSTQKLSNEVLDPNNTIFGIIYPSKKISCEAFNDISSRFPGEKLPIFLDTSKFY
jgi:hypothetical protein